MPVPLEELALLPVDDAEDAIQAQMPEGFDLTIELTPPQWSAALYSPDRQVLWQDTHPDKRILLFDFYGWFLRHTGARPRHPAWHRSGEVVVAPRHGAKAHQAHISLPDPEDLEPSEILSVYGIQPRKKDVIR